jgi:fucose permease
MANEELLPTNEFSPEETVEESAAPSTPRQYTTNQAAEENSLKENLQAIPDTQVSHLRIKFQIGFAFFTFVLLGANDAAIGVLLPHWGNYYNVDKAMLSLIFFAGSVGYLVAALNSNFLSRKLGNVKFLSLGKLAFLSGVFVFCFQPPIYLLLSVPFLLGFGAAILEAALNAHMAKLPNKGILLNYLHAFYGAGALLSPFIGSYVLESDLSWTWIYFVITVLTFALLISIRWLFTNSDRAEAVTESEGENTAIESPLKYRFVWLFAFFSLFYAGAEISLGNWSYSFLTQYRNEGTVLAGWLMSGYWLGLTMGRVLLAPLINRLGSQRVVNICLMGTISGVLILNFMTFSFTSAFGLLLAGFCLGPIMPTALAFLSNVVPPHLLTGSISFIASLGSVGKALFPWIAGNIADELGLEMFLPYVIAIVLTIVISWIAILTRANSRPTFIQSAAE